MENHNICCDLLLRFFCFPDLSLSVFVYLCSARCRSAERAAGGRKTRLLRPGAWCVVRWAAPLSAPW